MSEEKLQRKIIHVDMDAFFASVEQHHNPKYKGKPLAVGSADRRGVVAAASYEARKFGVRSAMSSVVAKQKCPQLIFVPSNFSLYRAISQEIRSIFHEYTDLVEPLSLDEAYLDVTDNFINQPSASMIAEEIRCKIYKTTHLTASAGVSYNKFLAKTASDIKKPKGLTIIKPQDAIAFIHTLPIERFYGVGKVTAKKFISAGIKNGKDLSQCSLSWLVDRFGKSGNYYYHVARGIDNREVNPNRIRKSIGVEETFDNDLHDREDMYAKLYELATELVSRCKKNSKFGVSLTLKVKLDNFKLITRCHSVMQPLDSVQSVYKLAQHLINVLLDVSDDKLSIRLLGLSISKLQQEVDVASKQLELHLN